MKKLIVADHLPVRDRGPFWSEVFADVLAPVEMVWSDPTGFAGPVQIADLGVVRVATIAGTAYEARRTPRLIRPGDPGSWQLVLNRGCRSVIVQQRRTAVLGPSDMAIYCTARPLRLRTCSAARDGRLVVITPNVSLPLPCAKIDQLAVTVLAGGTGIGALLADYVAGLDNAPDPLPAADAVRLGTILVDLLGLVLTHELESRQPATASNGVTNGARPLALRVLAFIEQHLDEPELSPASVAAAHHMSVRQLHRLFEGREHGVAGWIRARRLESARRDLADPRLWDRPVHLIAARWGFPSAAHFSRAFRAAYGLTPKDYRHRQASPH